MLGFNVPGSGYTTNQGWLLLMLGLELLCKNYIQGTLRLAAACSEIVGKTTGYTMVSHL